MAKQRILPFFIPMEGCPYHCVYCDQVAISGHVASPSAEEITVALAAFPTDPQAEIALYGGSFTCLPRSRQLYYLQAAAPAIAAGRIGGIRISTRPDAVDAATCSFLQEAGVTTVELGVQSFNSKVLAAAGRGYQTQTAEKACLTVREAGLRLGVQLMTGLPEDTPRLAREAVLRSAELGAELLRIYPTLVLADTALAAWYQQGDYMPQSLAEAVSCCRDMAIAARAKGLTIIRMGINPSADVESALVAGPYHPAFGGLVLEAVKKAQIIDLLADYDTAKAATLYFPPVDLPLIWGHKRASLQQLTAAYPLLTLQSDTLLPRGSLRWVCGEESRLSQETYWCQKTVSAWQ